MVDLRQRSSERRRETIVAAWVAMTAGCSLAGGYAAPTTELCDNSVDDDLDGRLDCADEEACGTDPACDERGACHDERDQDLDFLVDCDDPDCDGQCTEADRDRCSNARDDDGDGHRDWADPGCWPFAAVRLVRCPSIEGANVMLEPRLGEWRSEAGPVEESADPFSPSRFVLGLREAGHGELRATRRYTGAWAATRVTLRAYLEGDATISLLAGPVYAALAQTSPRQIELVSEGVMDEVPVPAVPGWWAIDVSVDRVDADQVTITMSATPDGGTTVRATISPPRPWPLTSEIDLFVSLELAGSGAALIGDATIERPAGPACRDTPVGIFGAALATASGGPLPCATGLGEGGPAAWLLRDGELEPGTLELPEGAAFPPAIAWDDAHGAYRGLALTSDGGLIVAESLDCRTWNALGNALAAPAEPPLPAPEGTIFGLDIALGYALRTSPGRPMPVHEAWYAAVSGEDRGVQFLGSPDGSPGSFAPTDFISLEPVLRGEPGALFDRDWRNGVSVAAIGNDHVFFLGGAERQEPGVFEWVVRVYVEQPGRGAEGFREIAPATIFPSDVPGAYDAFGGSFTGLLLETPTSEGRFAAYVIHHHVNSDTGDVALLTSEAPALCATPVAETCNEVDDDCDGVVDNVLVDETCNGLDDDCDGLADEDFTSFVSCGVGACRRTLSECAAGMGMSCVPGAPAIETCNSIDDDCDGRIDDGFTASGESCNAQDDDCDGTIDEDVSRSCVEASGCGVQLCLAGSWGACSRASETCNGIDDDCDGSIDDFPDSDGTCTTGGFCSGPTAVSWNAAHGCCQAGFGGGCGFTSCAAGYRLVECGACCER